MRELTGSEDDVALARCTRLGHQRNGFVEEHGGCPSCRSAVLSLVEGGEQGPQVTFSAVVDALESVPYLGEDVLDKLAALWTAPSVAVEQGPVLAVSQSPVAWQKCPVCDGTGLVSRPPWVAGDQREWMSSSTGPWPCKACHGTRMVIAAYASSASVPESEDGKRKALANIWKGRPSDWIAPLHQCPHCKQSLNWQTFDDAIERAWVRATCACGGRFSFPLFDAALHPDTRQGGENNG